jgi:RNA polymerase sigma factor (sigma-70 family)
LDFQTTYRDLYPALHRYALRLSGDPDVADDLVQEGFARLLEQELPLEEAKPWLYVVVANLFRDRVRNRDRRGRLLAAQGPVTDAVESPERTVERSEQIARVREALATLSERDRRMLLMREEGFKYREIADALDVQASSVGALVARALKRFARAYGADEAHETPDRG